LNSGEPQNGLENGLVIASYGRRGKLLDDNGNVHRFLCKGRKIKPVCGDRVEWTTTHDNETVVEAVAERRNELQRSGHKGKPEVLAANVDLLFVVMAHQPAPDLFVTDRYLAAARSMGAEAIVVLNKADIGSVDPEILNEYERLGYRTLHVSARNNEGTGAVKVHLQDKSGLLVGQSGVGKSSLINALIPDADAAVAEISEASGEGRHTTTASMMHRMGDSASDGWLIDSPGVRDFLPWLGEPRQVQEGFVEIEKKAEECRFANCQHLREPDCAVKDAVESDEISQHRYDSYKRLYHMTEEAKPGPG